jgi:proteic killer suppression protein
MDVEFVSSDLALVETDRAADTGLPVAVIHTARQRLALLRAAPDLGMLMRWKSFGYCEGPVGPTGERPVVIREEWRMWVKVDPTMSPPKAVVIDISQQLGGAA